MRDIEEARRFYGGVLGFAEGRSSTDWVDFNMFGHQFVVHLDASLQERGQAVRRAVDGHDVPVPHCGVVLNVDAWQALEQRVRGLIDEFVVEPHVRFVGQPGEQHTMFFCDPSGNALEFKAFADIERELFQTEI